jgi:hypothetical protein
MDIPLDKWSPVSIAPEMEGVLLYIQGSRGAERTTAVAAHAFGAIRIDGIVLGIVYMGIVGTLPDTDLTGNALLIIPLDEKFRGN